MNVDQETNVNVKDNQDQTPEAGNEGVKTPDEEATGKLFTQEEVNKMMQKRLAKEKEKWESKIEALTEAQKLALMSDEEKAQYEKQKQVKTFEEEKAEFERQKEAFNKQQYKLEIEKQLAEKNLPTTFSDMMIHLSAEEVAQKINELSSVITTNVNQTVVDKIKSTASTPIVPQETVTYLTLDQMQAMSEAEYLANKELVQASLKQLNQ